MCGIAGIARRRPTGVSADLLERMADAIRHRGPDGFGLHADERVGLTNVRLSVIDLARGAQPMTNEDGSVFIVYNGEIFNHLALRGELEARGHVFRTRSDTEVLVHAYEQWGERMLERLNGQFAFAIYDRPAGAVFLARDRFGILPLYYTERDGDLYFASEVKALLVTGEVERALDPEGLDEVFTFWAARPPRTPFRGIRALEPGCCARWQDGRLTLRRYYAFDYPEAPAEPADALDALDELLRSAVRLRLQADVPVGGYLSGGIDSSIVCALAAVGSPHALRTFSVTFEDPTLDESAYQYAVAADVRSRHAVQRIGRGDIARVFPDVIRHTETPLVRTAPAPLYLLSQVVREHGIKVVLTGEGSDEVFLGYDLFKEAIIRLLCWRRPGSRLLPRLLDGLYPGIAPGAGKGDFWRGYFMTAGTPDDPLFSHLPRFQLTARIKDFYSAEFRAGLGSFDPLAELRARLPAGFGAWSPWRTASRPASPISTTGYSNSRLRFPRAASFAACGRSTSCAAGGAPPALCRRPSPAAANSHTGRRTCLRSSTGGHRSTSRRCWTPRASGARGSSIRRPSPDWCDAAVPGGRKDSARARRSSRSFRPSCGTGSFSAHPPRHAWRRPPECSQRLRKPPPRPDV